ncbi:hypothetical protein M2158_004820 [Streptomyces sp. SAI-144]|uniref:hypothetical protein n=1 Tax=Streptomyces sp. SAI-144 TaxID=2940544 RepID=UPI0024768515|nr:hypothetical protein [Streptomyces sp. SAI-144]MDH6436280.1 hypothetical protein [Streptomyces sp. SAI-144]
MKATDADVSFTPVMRALTVVVGAGSFGLGACAVFVTQNGSGAAALIVFGGVLLLLALLGSRIDSLEFAGATLRLRAAAAQRFALAEESERQGDVVAARALRAEARTLLEAAGPVAAEYGAVRASMRPGPSRTRALEEVIARARHMAHEQSFESIEVLRWLRHGTDEERITALAMMQASPDLRDFDAVLAVIAQPRTPFEQYHAMRLALQMADTLNAEQAGRLAAAVRALRGVRFRRDSDRSRLREEILRKVRGDSRERWPRSIRQRHDG